MATLYKGRNVVTRNATDHDEGYVREGDQVVVTFDDGTTQIVSRNDLVQNEDRHQYQGRTVQVLRDARASDVGRISGLDQVLVRLEDGTLKLVNRSEVSLITPI